MWNLHPFHVALPVKDYLLARHLKCPLHWLPQIPRGGASVAVLTGLPEHVESATAELEMVQFLRLPHPWRLSPGFSHKLP